MHKQLLDKFFKENPVDGKNPSAAAIGHFMLEMLLSDNSEQFFNTIEDAVDLTPEREAEVAEGLEKVEAAATSQEILKLMRSKLDMPARRKLYRKAEPFKSEIVPEIVRMLKRSLNDHFIETAVQFLTAARVDVSEELIAGYDDVRNPYAQSKILLQLGFTADERHIPWLIDQYHVLKKAHPEERLFEGAYYGLHEMWNRFYA